MVPTWIVLGLSLGVVLGARPRELVAWCAGAAVVVGVALAFVVDANVVAAVTITLVNVLVGAAIGAGARWLGARLT